jgi:hypothetical protein
MPIPIDLLNQLTAKQCASRAQSFSRFTHGALLLAIVAAILWYVFGPSKDLVQSLGAGAAVWTLGKSIYYMLYRSIWRFGASILGAIIGAIAAGTTHSTGNTILYISIGIAVCGNVSARYFDVILISISMVFVYPYFLIVKRGRPYRSLSLASQFFREALCRGNIPLIFEAAEYYAERLILARRAADLPDLLNRVSDLARSERAIVQYANFAALLSASFDYQGNTD